jgi:tRNA(Ile)-lysidine synthase
VFLRRLWTEIETHGLFETGERVLVGVSGGPDSTALLCALHALRENFGWTVGAIHVNHQLRGEESEEDARYVGELCREREIPLRIVRIDVSEHLRRFGGNKQDVARRLRYEAFREAAGEWGASRLALAHHADDQAETILMRILRGTGPGGLAGMERIRRWNGIWIVRPLLSFTRQEIEAFCKEQGLRPRQDSSNFSTAYTRNRVRLQLMPMLESFNPRVREALVQLSDIVREEERVWEQWVKKEAGRVTIRREKGLAELDVSSFLHLPVALQRRTVKLILSYLLDEGTPEATLDAVERARMLAVGDHPSASADLPGGILAEREYGILRLTRRNNMTMDPAKAMRAGVVRIPLAIPGTTRLSGLSGVIEAIETDRRLHDPGTCSDWAVFDLDALDAPIVVRSRLPGDRMTVFGMEGTKKLKDLMMEARIPRRVRDRHPVVEAGGRVLWVPGVRRSALAPVTSGTRRFLYLLWHSQ